MSYAKITITEGIDRDSINVTVEADPPIPVDPDGEPLVEMLSDVQAAAVYAARVLYEACGSGEWRTLLI